MMFSAIAFAQVPTGTGKTKTLGTLQANGMTLAINPYKADTLKSGDTIFYKIPIYHSSVGVPYISLNTTGVSSDTTSTLTFWQSVNGKDNWQQINTMSKSSILVFDTTLVYGNGLNDKSNYLLDTTKRTKGYNGTFNALYAGTITEKNRALYKATESEAISLSAYSQTIAKATTTGIDISFLQKGLTLESSYLGIRFIASVKSGFKTIYDGSIRLNSR